MILVRQNKDIRISDASVCEHWGIILIETSITLFKVLNVI